MFSKNLEEAKQEVGDVLPEKTFSSNRKTTYQVRQLTYLNDRDNDNQDKSLDNIVK
jgi:hypothetical protein